MRNRENRPFRCHIACPRGLSQHSGNNGMWCKGNVGGGLEDGARWWGFGLIYRGGAHPVMLLDRLQSMAG